jgi:hypothetical protein
MTQKVMTNDEEVAGSNKFCIASFGTFGRYVTNLRGTFVENVKKAQSQTALLYSIQCTIYMTQILFFRDVSFMGIKRSRINTDFHNINLVL